MRGPAAPTGETAPFVALLRFRQLPLDGGHGQLHRLLLLLQALDGGGRGRLRLAQLPGQAVDLQLQRLGRSGVLRLELVDADVEALWTRE